MNATLSIKFEDGSEKQIIISKVIEMNLSADRKQSICFNQTNSGEWVMAFSKLTFENKKLKNLTLMKNQV